MITEPNTIIRIILYLLLFLSICTIFFLIVPFLRRIKDENKSATAKTIATWLGGITAVGTFCIAALNVKAPIGILPESDPAIASIKKYFSYIQVKGNGCEQAWALIHPERKQILANEHHGYDVTHFCKCYQTTTTYENLQITNINDSKGVGGSKTYRVSYDVIDEFPKNRLFFEIRSKPVGDALRTERFNDKEIFNGIVTDMRKYYDVADDMLSSVRAIVNNFAFAFLFEPDLISQIARLMKLNYGIELKEKETCPTKQKVKSHYEHKLTMLQDQGIWKIKNGLSMPELAAPYDMLKPL